MRRFDKAFALGEVEAEIRKEEPDLRLTATSHYGEDGFAYVMLSGVAPEREEGVLERAKNELADRGFPVQPIEGKDVHDVRPIPPET